MSAGELGYFGFPTTQPFIDGCLLDGVLLRPRNAVVKTPSYGANSIRMFDGSGIYQLDYRDGGKPEMMDFFSFAIEQRAIVENVWRKLQQVQAYGRPVWFIYFDYEYVAFSAGPEFQNFTLPRPTGKSALASFPLSRYPHNATLNGVAQTIIEAGTPIAGQVKILGNAVTVPTLNQGDVLIIGYVPAYSVAVTTGPDTFRGSNDLARTAILTEVRAWT